MEKNELKKTPSSVFDNSKNKLNKDSFNVIPMLNHKSFNKETKPNIKKKLLFPFRYYFFSIFIKNIKVEKNSIFISKKFYEVYCFIGSLLDISSYLLLQREFNVLKNSVFHENELEVIEKKKINVGSRLYNKEIENCIRRRKFNISR